MIISYYVWRTGFKLSSYSSTVLNGQLGSDQSLHHVGLVADTVTSSELTKYQRARSIWGEWDLLRARSFWGEGVLLRARSWGEGPVLLRSRSWVEGDLLRAGSSGTSCERDLLQCGRLVASACSLASSINLLVSCALASFSLSLAFNSCSIF